MLGTPTISTEVTISRVSYMVSPNSSVFIGLDIAGLEMGFFVDNYEADMCLSYLSSALFIACKSLLTWILKT